MTLAEKFTILAVDDTPDNLHLVSEMLKRDYHVKVANDGKNALRVARSLPHPDLILLDIMMPKMNGYEVCQQLKDDPATRDIPVLFLTALSELESESKGLELGAEDFITKPFNPDIIRHRIRKQLELKNHREHLQELVAQKTAALQASMADLELVHRKMLHQQQLATLGQLAAGIAHEIKTPLSYISGNVRTVEKYRQRFDSGFAAVEGLLVQADRSERVSSWQEQKKSLKLDRALDDLQELVKESLEGIEMITRIVHNLKGFSRSEDAGCMSVAQINQLLDNSINIANNEIKYKAQVTRDYAELPMISCYPQQLNQVFINILVNAAQAMEQQGTIAISTRQQQNFIVIAMRDNGPGIPEEVRAHIFEPFFTTKQEGIGTGLGLSICHDIIERHNGLIEVESSPGTGTCFSLFLPVEPEMSA